MQLVGKTRKSREIVGENARKLASDRHVSGNRIAKDGGPPQRTTSRLLNGENSRLDSLDLLAQYYGVQPWQLLVPDMNFQAMVLPLGADGKPISPEHAQLLKFFEAQPPHVQSAIKTLLSTPGKDRTSKRR